ncbi:uncharacterized protein LOC128642416 [Bombina bombina]|uniref:uncharacterized protein LOC128642416 n=1 Tax=Bombina bombina TaxID=8345 RepID=UPI00235AB84C|nr:uncharacterized protein LOC128642416 [Bombina bombina]
MDFLQRHLPRVFLAVQSALEYLNNVTAQIFGTPTNPQRPPNRETKVALGSTPPHPPTDGSLHSKSERAGSEGTQVTEITVVPEDSFCQSEATAQSLEHVGFTSEFESNLEQQGNLMHQRQDTDLRKRKYEMKDKPQYNAELVDNMKLVESMTQEEYNFPKHEENLEYLTYAKVREEESQLNNLEHKSLDNRGQTEKSDLNSDKTGSLTLSVNFIEHLEKAGDEEMLVKVECEMQEKSMKDLSEATENNVTTDLELSNIEANLIDAVVTKVLNSAFSEIGFGHNSALQQNKENIISSLNKIDEKNVNEHKTDFNYLMEDIYQEKIDSTEVVQRSEIKTDLEIEESCQSPDKSIEDPEGSMSVSPYMYEDVESMQETDHLKNKREERHDLNDIIDDNFSWNNLLKKEEVEGPKELKTAVWYDDYRHRSNTEEEAYISSRQMDYPPEVGNYKFLVQTQNLNMTINMSELKSMDEPYGETTADKSLLSLEDQTKSLIETNLSCVDAQKEEDDIQTKIYHHEKEEITETINVFDDSAEKKEIAVLKDYVIDEASSSKEKPEDVHSVQLDEVSHREGKEGHQKSDLEGETEDTFLKDHNLSIENEECEIPKEIIILQTEEELNQPLYSVSDGSDLAMEVHHYSVEQNEEAFSVREEDICNIEIYLTHVDVEGSGELHKEFEGHSKEFDIFLGDVDLLQETESVISPDLCNKEIEDPQKGRDPDMEINSVSLQDDQAQETSEEIDHLVETVSTDQYYQQDEVKEQITETEIAKKGGFLLPDNSEQATVSQFESDFTLDYQITDESSFQENNLVAPPSKDVQGTATGTDLLSDIDTSYTQKENMENTSIFTDRFENELPAVKEKEEHLCQSYFEKPTQDQECSYSFENEDTGDRKAKDNSEMDDIFHIEPDQSHMESTGSDLNQKQQDISLEGIDSSSHAQEEMQRHIKIYKIQEGNNKWHGESVEEDGENKKETNLLLETCDTEQGDIILGSIQPSEEIGSVIRSDTCLQEIEEGEKEFELELQIQSMITQNQLYEAEPMQSILIEENADDTKELSEAETPEEIGSSVLQISLSEINKINAVSHPVSEITLNEEIKVDGAILPIDHSKETESVEIPPEDFQKTVEQADLLFEVGSTQIQTNVSKGLGSSSDVEITDNKECTKIKPTFKDDHFLVKKTEGPDIDDYLLGTSAEEEKSSLVFDQGMCELSPTSEMSDDLQRSYFRETSKDADIPNNAENDIIKVIDSSKSDDETLEEPDQSSPMESKESGLSPKQQTVSSEAKDHSSHDEEEMECQIQIFKTQKENNISVIELDYSTEDSTCKKGTDLPSETYNSEQADGILENREPLKNLGSMTGSYFYVEDSEKYEYETDLVSKIQDYHDLTESTEIKYTIKNDHFLEKKPEGLERDDDLLGTSAEEENASLVIDQGACELSPTLEMTENLQKSYFRGTNKDEDFPYNEENDIINIIDSSESDDVSLKEPDQSSPLKSKESGLTPKLQDISSVAKDYSPHAKEEMECQIKMFTTQKENDKTVLELDYSTGEAKQCKKETDILLETCHSEQADVILETKEPLQNVGSMTVSDFCIEEPGKYEYEKDIVSKIQDYHDLTTGTQDQPKEVTEVHETIVVYQSVSEITTDEEIKIDDTLWLMDDSKGIESFDTPHENVQEIVNLNDLLFETGSTEMQSDVGDTLGSTVVSPEMKVLTDYKEFSETESSAKDDNLLEKKLDESSCIKTEDHLGSVNYSKAFESIIVQVQETIEQTDTLSDVGSSDVQTNFNDTLSSVIASTEIKIFSMDTKESSEMQYATKNDHFLEEKAETSDSKHIEVTVLPADCLTTHESISLPLEVSQETAKQTDILSELGSTETQMDVSEFQGSTHEFAIVISTDTKESSETKSPTKNDHFFEETIKGPEAHIDLLEPTTEKENSSLVIHQDKIELSFKPETVHHLQGPVLQFHEESNKQQWGHLVEHKRLSTDHLHPGTEDEEPKPQLEENEIDSELPTHNTLDVSAQKSRVILRRKTSIRRRQQVQRQSSPDTEPSEPPPRIFRPFSMGVPVFPGKLPPIPKPMPAEEHKDEPAAKEELAVKPKGVPKHAGFGIPHPMMMQELQARLQKKKPKQ